MGFRLLFFVIIAFTASTAKIAHETIQCLKCYGEDCSPSMVPDVCEGNVCHYENHFSSNKLTLYCGYQIDDAVDKPCTIRNGSEFYSCSQDFCNARSCLEYNEWLEEERTTNESATTMLTLESFMATKELSTTTKMASTTASMEPSTTTTEMAFITTFMEPSSTTTNETFTLPSTKLLTTTTKMASTTASMEPSTTTTEMAFITAFMEPSTTTTKTFTTSFMEPSTTTTKTFTTSFMEPSTTTTEMASTTTSMEPSTTTTEMASTTASTMYPMMPSTTASVMITSMKTTTDMLKMNTTIEQLFPKNISQKLSSLLRSDTNGGMLETSITTGEPVILSFASATITKPSVATSKITTKTIITTPPLNTTRDKGEIHVNETSPTTMRTAEQSTKPETSFTFLLFSTKALTLSNRTAATKKWKTTSSPLTNKTRIAPTTTKTSLTTTAVVGNKSVGTTKRALTTLVKKSSSRKATSTRPARSTSVPEETTMVFSPWQHLIVEYRWTTIILITMTVMLCIFLLLHRLLLQKTI